MASRHREIVAPIYLFLCLVMGGSVQGAWANMLLQLCGLGIIAWAATSAHGVRGGLARSLFTIVIAGLVLIALQLVPMPASLWTTLGPRDRVAAGFAILGVHPSLFALSLSPYDTLTALLTLIPPVAMLCAMLSLKAYRASWLALAVLGGTFAGIVLGVLQVASGSDQESPWYPYSRTNLGFATGFFANANHMATLLVVSLPFLAALLRSARGVSAQRNSAVTAIAAASAIVILVGLVLNRSLAGYVLVVPALAACAVLLMPIGSPARWWGAILGLLFLIVALGALQSSSIRPNGFEAEAQGSVDSRGEILATTLTAIKDFAPLGSGIGTFRQVYDLYENADRVNSTWVIHAHNDYAEIALEGGLPALVLLMVFLGWWGIASSRAWRAKDGGSYARAAAIASAVILAHSLVDFPLRTAAISATFAMCLALLAERRAPTASVASDLRPTRHIVLG